uniref:Putative secreted protein n=1 Tax=Ixodes ricinus TaxID=34613 RepID=A0A6B0UTU5_IXORI
MTSALSLRAFASASFLSCSFSFCVFFSLSSSFASDESLTLVLVPDGFSGTFKLLCAEVTFSVLVLNTCLLVWPLPELRDFLATLGSCSGVFFLLGRLAHSAVEDVEASFLFLRSLVPLLSLLSLGPEILFFRLSSNRAFFL